MKEKLNNKEIDLNILPDEYKKEVIDYYYFVLEKYKKEKRENGISSVVDFEDELLPKKVKQFIPLESEQIYE